MATTFMRSRNGAVAAFGEKAARKVAYVAGKVISAAHRSQRRGRKNIADGPAAALVKAGFKNVSILKGGMHAYLALKLPTQSAEDDEFGPEVIEKFRDSRPSASDLKRDAERLKKQMKIEKPKF